MAEDKKSKRIIVPSLVRGEVSKVNRVQSMQDTVDDAKITLANEISKFRDKSFGRSLDLKEARVFSQLIDSLVKLSKEEREVTKAFDTENMTEEELREAVKALLEKEEK